MTISEKKETIVFAIIIIFGVLTFVMIILCLSRFIRSLFSLENTNSKLELVTPRDESIVIVYENGTVILN